MELRVDITPASVNSIQMLRCIQHHTLAYTLSASVLRSLNTNTNTDWYVCMCHGARFKWKHTKQQHCNNDWLPFENLCVSGEKETTNRRSKLINHFHFRFRWVVYSSLFFLSSFFAPFLFRMPFVCLFRILGVPESLFFRCCCRSLCVLARRTVCFPYTHSSHIICVDALSSYSVVMLWREKMNVRSFV